MKRTKDRLEKLEQKVMPSQLAIYWPEGEGHEQPELSPDEFAAKYPNGIILKIVRVERKPDAADRRENSRSTEVNHL